MHARYAEDTARRYLRAALPRRWAHVQQVAARAKRMAVALSDGEGDLLCVAAWLHDVGYAPELVAATFHPLDGARFLRRIDAPERVVGLVAFHSSAAAEADALGLAEQMHDFHDERTLVRDLLWFADMTTGPHGDYLAFEHRMADVRDRYPPNHYVIRALDVGMDERRAAVARAETWLQEVGLTNQV